MTKNFEQLHADAATQGVFKFKVGELVKVKSGKLYQIERLRGAGLYREDGYSAVQLRDGKRYGPTRVFKESALVAA